MLAECTPNMPNYCSADVFTGVVPLNVKTTLNAKTAKCEKLNNR